MLKIDDGNRTEAAALFKRHSVPPSIYHRLLEAVLGIEYVDWEYGALFSELRDLLGVEVEDPVRSKLLATRAFLSSKVFEQDPHAFENIVLAVNDLHYYPDILTLSAPEEIVYAIRVLSPLKLDKAKYIGETLDQIMYYSDPVIGYVKTCCEQAGLLVYPEELRFAADPLPVQLRDVSRDIKPMPLDKPLEEASVAEVQSAKLYQIAAYVASKLAQGV